MEKRSNSGCSRETVSSILVKSTRPLKRDARSLWFCVLPRPSMPWLNTKKNWLMAPEESAESPSTRTRKPRSRSSVARRRALQVEEDAAVLGRERQRGDVEVALARADDRV